MLDEDARPDLVVEGAVVAQRRQLEVRREARACGGDVVERDRPGHVATMA
jgi:hypothetical protein